MACGAGMAQQAVQMITCVHMHPGTQQPCGLHLPEGS